MKSNEWLAQVVEPILEPDLPFCDPHHHLRNYPANLPFPILRMAGYS